VELIVLSCRSIVIAGALDQPMNGNVASFISLIQLFFKIFSIDVILYSTAYTPLNHKLFYESNGYPYWDLSRYKLLLNNTRGDEPIFLFNDTLGNGRKLNYGLKVYIFIALIFTALFNSQLIWAPLDSNHYRRWICTYFIIGKANYISQFFNLNWQISSKKISNAEKREIIRWISIEWRRANSANIKMRRTKYKCCLIEKTMFNTAILENKVIPFSKSNFLRIINKWI
jgi:hypothetical protein